MLGNWKELAELGLTNNEFTDVGVRYLLQDGFNKLKKISLDDNYDKNHAINIKLLVKFYGVTAEVI